MSKSYKAIVEYPFCVETSEIFETQKRVVVSRVAEYPAATYDFEYSLNNDQKIYVKVLISLYSQVELGIELSIFW